MSVKARYLPYVAFSERRTRRQEAARRPADTNRQPKHYRHDPFRRWWQMLVQTIGGAYR